MIPRGGGFLSVAGTGNHAGASPSRSEWHRQDRVGCIVECDQPKGEQKGAYSLHPRRLSEDDCVYRLRIRDRAALIIVLPCPEGLASKGMGNLVIGNDKTREEDRASQKCLSLIHI